MGQTKSKGVNFHLPTRGKSIRRKRDVSDIPDKIEPHDLITVNGAPLANPTNAQDPQKTNGSTVADDASSIRTNPDNAQGVQTADGTAAVSNPESEQESSVDPRGSVIQFDNQLIPSFHLPTRGESVRSSWGGFNGRFEIDPDEKPTADETSLLVSSNPIQNAQTDNAAITVPDTEPERGFSIDLRGSIVQFDNQHIPESTDPTPQEEMDKPPFNINPVPNLTGSIKIVKGPLLAGGFCDVYSGELTSERGTELVAMKMLRVFNTEAHVRKAKRKFRREVKIWCSLRHPYMLPFYGTCEHDEIRLFMVSPWADGGNSLEYLRRNPFTDRSQLLSQTSSALEYLHSGRDVPQIVHGDLKADNVLISRKGEALLSDFGLSRYVEEIVSKSGSSSAGRAGGHVRFMAPELLMPPKTTSQTSGPTPKSDVFSFASLMLQLYTEELPFADLLEAQAIFRVASGEIPARPVEPSVLGRGLDDHLWTIMTDCWQFRPSDRPEMKEVMDRMASRAHRRQPLPRPLLLAAKQKSGDGTFRDRDQPEAPFKSRIKYRPRMRLNGGSGSPRTETSLSGGMDASTGRKMLVVKEAQPATHYQLGHRIGHGQFGSVYRAINLNTGQMVAVKRLSLEGMSEAYISQLIHEVELAMGLSHPGLVNYEGMTRDTDTLHIVLEFVGNGSLAKTLEAFGKLNEKLVASYVTKVLEALHYMHRFQVIHGNLKAANIMTTKTGGVKLADFGLSLNIRSMETIKHNNSLAPNWTAPEVLELKGVSPASDIWSLACTIIELLKGQPPYADILNGVNVMFRIIEDPMPPIPEGLSEQLHQFLSSCFHNDPGQRPSAEELLEHSWLKQGWGVRKELISQDSNSFLRRVSAD